MECAPKQYMNQFSVWGVALFIALLLTGALLADGTATSSILLFCLIVGICVIALLRPIPGISGLSRKPAGIFLVLTIVLGLPISNTMTAATVQTQALTKLKTSDPSAYLDALKANGDDEAYISEAAVLDPERHRLELERIEQEKAAQKEAKLQKTYDDRLAHLMDENPRMWLETLTDLRPEVATKVRSTSKTRTAELATAVKLVPASDTGRNLKIYAELFALNPENESYLNKWNFYASKREQQLWAIDNCKEDKADYVAIIVQDAVKGSLKSPSTAKFPWALGGQSLGNCRYRVRSHVDSQNGFGAMLRTEYEVEVELTPGGYKIVKSNIY